MAWKENVARQRIIKTMGDVPNVDVRSFSDQYYPEYLRKRQILLDAKQDVSPPLFKLPPNKAVLVDTVQIYIQITNYDDYRLSQGVETEGTHEKALRFLHFYYTACDRVAESTSAQRIDFHGARMHAAILSDARSSTIQDSVAQAIEFIREFRTIAAEANRELANSDFLAEFRIGVDVGRCVAINNGTGSEQEPMFLGSAANHAAKLADGPEPGVFFSDSVRELLGMHALGGEVFGDSLSDVLLENVASQIRGRQPTGRIAPKVLDQWREDIQKKADVNPTSPNFVFHTRPSPLSEIDFAEVSPSNSIRMQLLSTFADIDGYTNYIDSCIQAEDVADAVKALYVVREELKAVVEEDFGGKKIRFIGDCIHAVNAEANYLGTDSRATVNSGAKCAGALRSSFEICKEELGSIDDLDIAIGVELGPTPISKIGIRGERSVRVASSRATTESELLQSQCAKSETQFGPNALAAMGPDLRELLSHDGIAVDLSYDDVVLGISEISADTGSAVYAQPRAHHLPRAHFTSE